MCVFLLAQYNGPFLALLYYNCNSIETSIIIANFHKSGTISDQLSFSAPKKPSSRLPSIKKGTSV